MIGVLRDPGLTRKGARLGFQNEGTGTGQKRSGIIYFPIVCESGSSRIRIIGNGRPIGSGSRRQKIVNNLPNFHQHDNLNKKGKKILFQFKIFLKLFV